jgi:hypothetical protein
MNVSIDNVALVISKPYVVGIGRGAGTFHAELDNPFVANEN